MCEIAVNKSKQQEAFEPLIASSLLRIGPREGEREDSRDEPFFYGGCQLSIKTPPARAVANAVAG